MGSLEGEARDLSVFPGGAWPNARHGGVALHVDEMVPAFVLRDHVVADLRNRV